MGEVQITLRTPSVLMAFRIACMFSVLLGLLASSAKAGDPDIGYDLLFKSAGPDVQRTCHQVPGLHPPQTGAFFIGGPGKFEMGGYQFKSYFDGFGRMNRFELQDGKVCYTAKLMSNTSYYKEAALLGRPTSSLFMGFEPPLPACPLTHPFCKLQGMEMDNNWVNLLHTNNADEGLLLTDSPMFLRFDYETMEVKGRYPWKDGPDGGMMPHWLKPFHFPATGSAHPVRRPKTESTYIEVMLEVGLSQALAVYSIDIKTMDRTLLAHAPMKGAMMFHTFGVTENYVVLPCTIKMSISLSGYLSDMYEDGWDGIHVVDHDGNVQVFDTEKFYHVHIANTFENETGIVMDLSTFQKIPFAAHTVGLDQQFNKSERDNKQGTMTERIHLHLTGPKKGEVTREHLGIPGRFEEWFKINHHVWGLPYCNYYGVEFFHNDKDYANMAVFKHNVCENKRTYWSKQYVYTSEPYFLPRSNATTPDAEDDGWLFFVALNGVRKASDFIILDGKTFMEIAIVELATHIPFLAHGQFIPKAEEASVKSALQVEHPDLAAAVEAFIAV